jgi:predicted peptidase
MHGTGGTSFFTHSRKSLRSAGLQHAATKFVVVSPDCDWTWKEVPKPWITQLAETLRAAEWIDPNRIYLSGCSMGGMSTWEVGAERPDLFAAIAPVAGHHQVEREPWIARQLREMPIFVVASAHDGTCPYRLEKPLWELLIKGEGNESMVVNVAEHIDHCSMYERAYCEDTVLYDWLLLFSKEP